MDFLTVKSYQWVLGIETRLLEEVTPTSTTWLLNSSVVVVVVLLLWDKCLIV